MRLTKKIRVRTNGGVETLPVGRCLPVATCDEHGFFLELDNGEHVYVRRGDPRIVEAAAGDPVNEPVE